MTATSILIFNFKTTPFVRKSVSGNRDMLIT